jgi:hypothetical protein
MGCWCVSGGRTMTPPRLHHYVPQFYLRRFANADGKFWAWDKPRDRTFLATPKTIAAETDFYWLHAFERMGHDPLTMERQLSDLEGEAALITAQWLSWTDLMAAGETIPIPTPNREIIARYIALQFLRTADTKETLGMMYELDHPGETLTEKDRTGLHTRLLWNLKTLEKFEKHIAEAIWVFGRNKTATPFWTSDNPVAFKTGNNKMWLKTAFALGEPVQRRPVRVPTGTAGKSLSRIRPKSRFRRPESAEIIRSDQWLAGSPRSGRPKASTLKS